MAHGLKQSPAEKRRQDARTLFIRKGWAVDEIAKHLDVHPQTVRRWQKQDRANHLNWSCPKAAVGVGKREEYLVEIINDYLEVHRNVMEEIRNTQSIDAVSKTRVLASLADTFNKTTKAASKVSPEIASIANAYEVLQQLTRYIIDHHGDLAPDFAEILDDFGHWIAKEKP